MYRIAFLILSSICLIHCANRESNSSLPYYNTPDFTPIFIDDLTKVDGKITHKIEDFAFLNQDSILITQEYIKDKIHVANFVFTTCGSICPSMTENMKEVSDAFVEDKEVKLLSYSVTPWIDRPHVLKEYKELYEISNTNWQFLTGKKSDIYTLARTSYFAEEDIGFSKDSSDFLHTEHFILVDGSKRIRGIYNGTLRLEMKQLKEDIKALKED